MGTDCHFKRNSGLVILALAGVQHGEVIVGFRQFRIIFGQAGKNPDGVIGLILFSQNQAFQEACLCVFGFVCQIGIDARQRLFLFPLFEQFADILNFIRTSGEAETQQQRTSAQCGLLAETVKHIHGVVFSQN